MSECLWRGTGNNHSFRLANNWSPTVVPGAGDSAIFDGSSPKTCNLSGDHTVGRLEMGAGFTSGALNFEGTFEVGGESVVRAGSLNPTRASSVLKVSGELAVSGADVAVTGGKVKGTVLVNGVLTTEGSETLDLGSDVRVEGLGPVQEAIWVNKCPILLMNHKAGVVIGFRGRFSAFGAVSQGALFQRVTHTDGAAETARDPDQTFAVSAGLLTVDSDVTLQITFPLIVSDYGSVAVDDSAAESGELDVRGKNSLSEGYSVLLETGGSIAFFDNSSADPVCRTGNIVFSTEHGCAVGSLCRLQFKLLEFKTAGHLVVQGLVENVWGTWDCDGRIYLLAGAIFAGASGPDPAYSRCRISHTGPAMDVDPTASLQWTMSDPTPPTPPEVYADIITGNTIVGDFGQFIFANGLFTPGPNRGPTNYDITYTGPIGGG